MRNRIANPEMMRAMNEAAGLYTSRYRANKAARYNEVTVKVCGGYVNMDARDYRIWRKQR